MNRTLQWFNLLGVLIVSAVCVIQWSGAREAAREISDGNSAGNRLIEQISDLTTKLQQVSADLDGFRQRVQAAETSVKEAHRKLAAAEENLAGAVGDRDRLRSDLAKWQAAVAQRDRAIAALNVTLEKALDGRDQAIRKTNDMVSTLNDDWKQKTVTTAP